MTVEEKILRLCKKVRCEKASHVGTWKGFEVYVPYEDNPGYGGTVFILVDGEEVRWASGEEWLELLRVHF